MLARAGGRAALRLHAAGAGRSPRRRARRRRALRQGRLGEPPDLLVQGPGGLGRDLEGDRVRLRHRVLRLDRQPRQQRVGARRARRACNCFIFIPDDLEQGKIIGSAIYGPRTVADPRQLRRRQPPVQRDRRQVPLGVRQHQPPPVLHRRREDVRLRDRRAARLAPAAARRRARPPAARSCPRSPRRSRSSRRSAW